MNAVFYWGMEEPSVFELEISSLCILEFAFR